MKKKIISILIMLVVIGAIITNQLIAYAKVADQPLYVNLMATDLNGIGYGIGNPNNAGKYIWNITTNDSDKGPVSQVQRNLYCVNADYGQTWFDNGNEETILGYELYYDIQSDRETLLDNLENDDNNMIRDLLNPEGNQYRQLLWLFDNFYIPKETNIEEFLERVGIVQEEGENGEILYYNKETNELYPAGEPLTESDILAIQKMAIWYFTNNEQYDYTDKSFWLNITEDAENYGTLSKSRETMAMDVYKYLINSAKEGADLYTAENNYKLESVPASVNTEGLEKENNKYILDMERKDTNYLIGPIVIDKNNDLGYDIEILVKDQANKLLTKETDYIYTDKNGKELEKTEKELVGLTDGFYISVPRSKVQNVNITISISYRTTPKKLWLDGEENENGKITLNSEQPIVEIIQDPKEIIVELTAKPQEFDLALRKYVTALHNKKGEVKEISNKRNLNNIDLDTLLTETTATYNHRKDPVIVEDGDEITYQIRIYNEGNHEGYASKIIDQLPIGLISSTNNPKTVVSKDKNGKVKNTYKLQFSTVTNQITLTIVDTDSEPAKNLQPYTVETGLDYEIIEIKCKVAQKPDASTQITLTNVAWIAEEYDSENEEKIVNEIGKDRDSEPGNAPSISKDKLDNYKGDKDNKSDLSDNDYYYKGEQDDEDFEKVAIMPVEKVFDLALFKHIAAISKDTNIEDGEYITDTGKKNGKYLRAPEVTAINPETGKITYKKNDKETLKIEPGDYVLYTIRVYNEGEINGYASKIKDTLPIGLEFVLENEKYNGIWKLEGLDSDGRQVVTTTWYAKGQGLELDTVEGDENYRANLLMALNKEAPIGEQNPDYLDAQILCRVTEKATSDRVLVNYAQISDDSDEDGNEVEDVDSTPDEWVDGEDDQDIERIKSQAFDLALRKFITNVGEKTVKSRVPVVKNNNGKISYEKSKDPLTVHVDDVITYTLRVYNEGNIAGYAKEVSDDIPEYLEFLPEHSTNVEYKWKMYDKNGKETQNKEDAVKIKTEYLSKENGKDNLINAFDGITLDYKDVKVAFKVKDPNSNTIIITNHAQISNDTDENGDEIKDIDSIPDEWNEGEDDQDTENIKVEYFDLSLLKFVTKVIVIEDGKQTITETGHNGHENPEPVVKVELHKKELNKVTVKFGFGITITNEGDIPGYATKITDYVPEGLKFDPTDNPEWMDEENNVISTKQLENVLLKPGESKTVEVILTWINGKDNLALKTNFAEISEDKNEYDVPDRDSTPNNKVEEEDDMDSAKVIINISTGSGKTYFSLTLGLLVVVLVGIGLIKKYVL